MRINYIKLTVSQINKINNNYGFERGIVVNQNIKNELKESPLFNISLCSKELAHSNFWAWMINDINIGGKNPFIEVFYPEFCSSNNSFIEAKREENHTDIKVDYKDLSGAEKCFLIENKIKSVPTYKQLKEYQDKNNNFAQGILTGIISTLDLKNNLPNWDFISYKVIAERINTINEKNKNNLDSFNYELIKHYCVDITNISILIEEVLSNNTNNYIINHNEELEKLRIGDVLLKLNAALFAEELKRRIKSDENELRSILFGLPKVESSYNNKNSTITIVYKEPLVAGEEVDDDDWNSSHEKGRIGVQIQGKQFRIYCGPSYEKSRYKDMDNLKNNFTSFGWFENYTDKKIRNRKSNMREKPGYCKYEKNYLHMYQYWIITDTSYDSLYFEIKQELLHAKTLIDANKVHF